MAEEKNKSKESILLEALDDINKELEKLRTEKDELENKLSETSADITGTQQEESILRGQIASLIGRESVLDRKKNEIKEKLEALKGKIAKVTKIKDELGEVE